MAVRQVVKEIHDLAAPRRECALGDEAVGLLPTTAVPDRPGSSTDCGGGDLGSDGLDAAVFGEPVIEH